MPLYHQSNLRRGRISETGRIYLITTTTYDRTPFFTDWRIGRLVIHIMMQEHLEDRVRSVAWVVMPDHLHWLLELKEANLSAVIRRVKSVSAKRVNAALGHRGCVWQKCFHDRAVRREDDLRAIARYVITNPIRAGIVDRIGDYPLWDAMWL
ncbi:REP-associated tyrosine transposase [Pseudomonas sp. TE3610]